MRRQRNEDDQERYQGKKQRRRIVTPSFLLTGCLIINCDVTYWAGTTDCLRVVLMSVPLQWNFMCFKCICDSDLSVGGIWGEGEGEGGRREGETVLMNTKR
jgi:hypothetical protein